MPRTKYILIYQDLKNKIEDGTYTFKDLLPSENQLIQMYQCSRNTVRRAIRTLITDGYVQVMQGKGIRNIFQPTPQTSFKIGIIESFREAACRNHQHAKTQVAHFEELVANKQIENRTGFTIGTSLYYLQRIHYLDNKPLILNHSYFLKDVVTTLTKEIAERSIYDYLENSLHITIVNSKRMMTIEKTTNLDTKYLHLGDYNCLAVVTSHTYTSDGIMFEYTQSRHRPDMFCFQDNAIRHPL